MDLFTFSWNVIYFYIFLSSTIISIQTCVLHFFPFPKLPLVGAFAFGLGSSLSSNLIYPSLGILRKIVSSVGILRKTVKKENSILEDDSTFMRNQLKRHCGKYYM